MSDFPFSVRERARKISRSRTQELVLCKVKSMADIEQIRTGVMPEPVTGKLEYGELSIMSEEKTSSTQELLPDVNMAEFHEAVDIVTAHLLSGYRGEQPRTTFSEIRPGYGDIESPVEAAYRVIERHGTFKFTGSDGAEKKILGINAPRMKEIKRAVANFAASGKVTVIMPFHHEAGSVGKNIRYASSLVGQHNTYGIATGSDRVSIKEAQDAGGMIFQQGRMFEALHIDWDTVRERVGIDRKNIGQGKSIVGNKGMTIYGGIGAVTLLAAYGIIPKDQIIAWHDTDIINPERDQDSSPEGYSALHTMLIPFLKETPEARVLMSIIAKNGPGRNNHPILAATNLLASLPNDSKIIKTALQLYAMSWPLSGERAFHLDVLRRMPIATGISLEVLANLYIAGLSVEENGYIANVTNPYPKIERQESPEEREF